MNEFFVNSTTIGVVISLISYAIGVMLKRKFNNPIFNPLLISIALVILFLSVTNIDYATYNNSAKYLSYLLAPATVSLAIPLYQKINLLKENGKAISIALIVGVLSSLISVLLLSVVFKLEKEIYITLLPKSVTTAIGMDIANELGGIGSVAAAFIIITGVIGYITSEIIFKIFRIKHPISKGLAMGASSHAMGTAKAVEIGEIEGAMSSLAIVICGILTIFGTSIFVQFL